MGLELLPKRFSFASAPQADSLVGFAYGSKEKGPPNHPAKRKDVSKDCGWWGWKTFDPQQALFSFRTLPRAEFDGGGTGKRALLTI